jgi:F0F1-type ATP synthase assembly protein I
MNLKKKIILFVFAYFTLFLIIESPSLGLQVYNNSSGQYTSLPKLSNGFIGSTLVFYSSSPIVNSTDLVIGYNISQTTFSFAGIFILILPFMIGIFNINQKNKKTDSKNRKKTGRLIDKV